MSRWTKHEQCGYLYDDFCLATKGGSSGLSFAKSGVSRGLHVLGGSRSDAVKAEPRILVEIEFLPYW